MNDALLMDIAHCETQLAEHSARLVFREPALLREVVEEFAARTEFGDKPDGRFSRNDLV